MPSEKPDLQLSEDVELRWIRDHGDIIGGLISHHDPNPSFPIEEGSDRCFGGFSLRGKGEAGHDEWDMEGTFEKPTLSPSFLCHCGFHGYVIEGKWMPA